MPWSLQVLSSIFSNQVRQALSVVLFIVPRPRNFLKATSFGNHSVSSFVCHLLKITVLHCLISNILKIVSSFDFFWCCFSKEDKFNSCYFFLAQTRSLLHFLFKNKRTNKQNKTKNSNLTMLNRREGESTAITGGKTSIAFWEKK